MAIFKLPSNLIDISLPKAAVQQDMMMSPYGAPGAGAAPGQPQDFVKLFKAEKDNLDLAQGLYHWSGDDVEIRVLQRWGKIAQDASKPRRR